MLKSKHGLYVCLAVLDVLVCPGSKGGTQARVGRTGRWEVALFAIRDIRPGEEVTVDYVWIWVPKAFPTVSVKAVAYVLFMTCVFDLAVVLVLRSGLPRFH